MSDINYTLQEFIEASNLWDEFGDVPMNPKTECIEEEWHGFPAETHREDIWHWFEDTFHVPVHTLMFPAQLINVKEGE